MRTKVVSGDIFEMSVNESDTLAWTTIPFHEDWTSSEDESDADEDKWCKPGHFVAFGSGKRLKVDPGIDLEWDPKWGMKASALIGPRRRFHSWLSMYSGPEFGTRCLHPIKCPEFPIVADYDLCWLLFAIQQRSLHHGHNTRREFELYYQAVILLSGRAIGAIS